MSSDWSRFPRYGFISEYGPKSNAQMDAVIDALNRYHINGLQFYDWFDTHHDPLAGTAANPDATWNDIANRVNTYATVAGYLDRAADRHMTTMAYNLLYGANDDAGAADDGVQNAWYLYTDTNATHKEVNPLPAGWKSDIYLTDPNHPDWRDYLGGKMEEALAGLPFDGWHIDQLGPRGDVYNAAGSPVDLNASVGPFIDAMKARPALADVPMVANAVGQYAQFGPAGIVHSDVEFLYTEVFGDYPTYNDLAQIVRDNHEFSDGRLATVLAAYMNYDAADSPGTFNTPAVLMTDAVVFAFGGAHIELGEHMLGKEYFPNDNLEMTADLRDRLVDYYDFLVGHQNILRDGGAFTDNPLHSTSTAMNAWPAQLGGVSVVSKAVDDKQVFHLINFTDANTLDWRDDAQTQPAPSTITSIDVSFFSHLPVGQLWVASPDAGNEAGTTLPFTQADDGTVTATVPSLEIWSMLVAQRQDFTGYDDAADPAYDNTWADGNNGGYGFGPWRLLAQSTPGGFAGFFKSADGSVDNAGALDRAQGDAWASFANKGLGTDRATAFRTLTQPLSREGDLLGLTLESGLIEGEVGVSLRSDTTADDPDDYLTDARMRLFFRAGDANYTLEDGSGTIDTGIGFTFHGVRVQAELNGDDTYDLMVWRYDEENDLTPQVFTFTDRLLAGTGPISSLAVYQRDTGSATVQSDVYLNHLYYHAVPQPASAAIGLTTLALMLRRRRA